MVRGAGGAPEKIDGTDPNFTAGESYFFNLSEDTLINYDGTSILMGKTIEPPVPSTENPFAGTYTGSFAGNYGPPQGTFTLTVSTAGALAGSGYNNSNAPPTAISPSGTVTTAGAATFYVTFTNRHKFSGTFTATGASGNFYETDGTTVKGTWSATKNAVTPQTVATPVITPSGGTFTTAQSVTITCSTSGATIKYTTDGSTPSSTAGNTYSSAISVTATTVIKAVAIKSGMTDSALAMATFTIGTQPSGTVPFLRKFGTKGTGAGQFTSGPINVAVEASTGYIFVSDTYGHRVLKFDSNGNYISAIGSAGSGNGQFQYPTGIAVTGGGEMFVVDYGNKRVQKFTTAGTFLKAFGSAGSGNGQFQAPDCVAVAKYGAVYVTDFQNNSVQRFSSEGNFIQKWGGPGTGDGQFGANSPKDIAIDSSDNVYVADIGNNRIQKFNAYGTYQTQWGISGSGNGQFTSPHGVCVDADGHVFVSDKSCRIQKFSPMGDFILSWGSSGTADGQFTDPSGICADANGNIYVADFGNSRVQVFGTASTPVVEKVATPSISPAGGTYTTAQSVTITCATSGATIKYTTDGTTPSASNGSVYSAAITVSASATVKAVAVKSGMTDSDVASATYTIQSSSANKVKTPVVSTVTLSSSTVVDLSSMESGVTYYYTLDGTDPSASNGTTWSGKIYIEYTTTFKIIGVKAGYENSDIVTKVISMPNSTALAGFKAVDNNPLGARRQACLVAHDGKLWVIGGRGFDGYMNDVWSSPDGISWTKVLENGTIGTATQFHGRVGHAAVSFGGKLWVIGGYNGSTYTNDVWASTNGVTWSEASASSLNKLTVRAHHTAMVFNNKMWVIGGFNSGSYYADVVSSSDGVNWTTETSSPGFTARAYHSGAVFNNKMWIIGGATGTTTYANDVWSSSDGTVWTRVTSAAAFTPRLGHRCLAFENKIWVLGGKDASSFTSDVYFSTDGATWKTPTKNPFYSFGQRAYMGAEVFNDKMWVVGGYGPGGSGPDTYLGGVYYSFY